MPRIAAAGLVLAVLLAWANSFTGPFVFDDLTAILANPTLDSFSTALSPPRDGGTVAGRPLLNLSFALNRAVGGTDVRGYHAVNLLIHVLATLTLFGLVRRTLCLPGRRQLAPPAATAVAFSAALLWAVHPLQTSAVTYVVQRAESLMALFFLATLYGFVSAAAPANPERPRAAAWLLACSVVACLAGMFCKEPMAVAPLVVLLLDRAFVAGTFSGALRIRWRYYLALAATWLPLAWLVASNSSRAGTAGFASKIAPVDYALTQCVAMAHYFGLAFWPRELVFDYGSPVVTSLTSVWPQALLLVVLTAGTAFALRRAPALGLLGAAFFPILAPSSSIVPVATQTIAEHRMYLPLAAIAVAVALALHHFLRSRAWIAAAVIAVPLALATSQRNDDYRDAVTLWSDTARKRPDNPRAHNHAGRELARAGRHAEAIAHFEMALGLAPDDAEVQNNLANALAASGRSLEALPHYEASVRLKPGSAASHLNFAHALLQAGRIPEAIEHYEAAEKIGPLDAEALCGLGVALASVGRIGDAIPRYERALQMAPAHARANYNLGLALVRTRRVADSVAHFRAAAQSDPSHLPARVNLGNALLLTGQAAAAVIEYEAALKLKPDDPQIRANLARARTMIR